MEEEVPFLDEQIAFLKEEIKMMNEQEVTPDEVCSMLEPKSDLDEAIFKY